MTLTKLEKKVKTLTKKWSYGVAKVRGEKLKRKEKQVSFKNSYKPL